MAEVYNLNELNKRIQALHTRYRAIKHRGTDADIARAEDWFSKWDTFYKQYKGTELHQDTLIALNTRYKDNLEDVAAIESKSKEIEANIQSAERELQLQQQEEIERQEREREIAAEKAKQVQPITQPQQPQVTKQVVKITTYGTKDWNSLNNSWNAVIDAWTRIETLPEQNIVNSVERSISNWLDFYETEIAYYQTLGQAIPVEIQNQIGKWINLYQSTKAVVEKALSESQLLSEAPTAAPLASEQIRLAPGQYIDPSTGQVMAAEHLVTAIAPQTTPTPSPVPNSVLPRLPSPVVLPAVEPAYTPPPTIIIKQTIPPYDPTEPEIPPDEPLIFEPAIRRISDIGGGLVEPTVSPEIYEEAIEEVKSNWPWLVGLGVVIFLARSR